MAKLGLKDCRTLTNPKNVPKTFKILPKRWIFAKSGHTGKYSSWFVFAIKEWWKFPFRSPYCTSPVTSPWAEKNSPLPRGETWDHFHNGPVANFINSWFTCVERIFIQNDTRGIYLPNDHGVLIKLFLKMGQTWHFLFLFVALFG